MKPYLIALFICHLQQLTAQEFFFRQMPVEYGSDVQQIKNIFQSADQLIWLGTDKGLLSFDGKTYQRFKRSDGKVSTVTAIAEYQNMLWIGYDDGHLQIITQGSITHIRTDSITNTSISKILFSKNGIAYIATYGEGLWKYEKNSFTRLQELQRLRTNDIYDALMDHTGRIWLASDNGIWIYDDSPSKQVVNINRNHGLPDDIVTLLHAKTNHDVWIGFYDHGFARYNMPQRSVISTIPVAETDGNVVSIATGSQNEVWLATEKSISRISSDNPPLRIKLPPQINDRITDCILDRTGNLWVASGNKLFVANTQLEYYHSNIKGIQSIAISDDNIFLGCDKGLYNIHLSNGATSQHLQNLALNILALHTDKKGYLWIGTFGQGLIIYDPFSKKHLQLTEKNGISNNSILNIDGEGEKIWLATLGGITEFDLKGKDPFERTPSISLYSEKYNFPAGYVYDVYTDDDGKVWFGTDGKGLYLLHEGLLKPYTSSIGVFRNDSFDLRTIYSITAGDSNTIWISAQEGNILKIDDKGNIIHHIASPYGSLNSLATAGNGELVIIREGSLQINNPVSGIFVLGGATGLSTFSPNINATAVDKDGSVWIADADKVLHYRKVAIDTSHYVHMHMVDVTPGSLQTAEPITLRPDSNFLDFRFTGLWYSDPQSIRYKYMLEGHDQDWIYSQEGRAVYSKLSPGTYTFIVSASHNDDFTHSLPVRREIIVLPPFYLTWWFIAGVIALIGFLTYHFMRERIRRLNRFHQLEKEKTTLQLNAIQAQVNPHFLFNSFNTLSGIIEEDQEAAVDYVDQLSAFFRGVLQHRNAELIPVKEEIEIMRNYVYILKKRYGPNIQVAEEIHSTEGFVAPLTLQLLVENAIKHNIASGEKPLAIRITVNDDWIEVSNPIQPKIQSIVESTGFGLSSLLTRYQYLTRTNIEIRNDANIFTVRIPVIHPNVNV